MKSLFRNNPLAAALDTMDDEQVLDYGRALMDGVAFATPVFDGATEKEIKEFLEKAGLPLFRQDQSLRRNDRGEVRTAGYGRLHLHAQALPLG